MDWEAIDKVQDVITLVAVPAATVLLIWILIEIKKLKSQLKPKE